MKTSRAYTTNPLQSRNNNRSQLMRKAAMLAAAVFSLLMMSAIASAQNVNVTATAGTPVATYTTLKGAFDAVNAGTHQGAITMDIVLSTTEGATPATLNSSGAGSAVYTSVLIRPAADGVSVSGNPATGFGVIQLKGSDNVTIDGDNPNTAGINRNLTVNNTNTTTAIANSAIRIATAASVVTSADNDTIKNCILNGNVTSGNAAAITSSSSSSNSSFGIYVGGNGGATATDAPTAITSVTANVAPSGTTVNNLLVTNNAVNQCARAIVFNGAATSVSTGVTITNNTVGDQGTPTPATPPYTTPATTVYTKGIWVAGTSSITVTGNALKNIMSYVVTTITTVELVSPIGATATISNNTITNPTNNNSGGSPVKAILVSNATGTLSISGNIISNVQSLASASGTAGIDESGAGVTAATIELNKITTVRNLSTSTFGCWGLSVGAGNNVVVRNNFVSDLNMDMTGGGAFSTTFGVHGIRIAGGTGHKIYHNSVNMFGALSGTAASSILTSAFTIVNTTQTGMDVRNNIFSNTLSGGTTSIAHVSIFLPTNSPTAMTLTNNNNAYFSGPTAASQGIAQAGTSAGTGFYLASNFNSGTTTPATNLRALTTTLGPATNDNASLASTAAAPFTSPTDLHIPAATATQLESGGASVGVTTDIDGDVRPGPAGSVNGGATAPDIGADEFDGVPLDLTPPVISYTPFGNTMSTANRTLSVTITDNIAVAGGANAPRIYYRKNGGSYFSNQCGAPTGNVYPCTIDYSLVGGVVLNDVIDYFVVAQDTAPTPNVAANPSAGFSATSVNSVTTPPTTPNTYKIVGAISGSFNVGAGETFTSLTNVGGIFDAINNAIVTGNITINITSDLSPTSGTLVAETGAVALNEYATGFTVTIQQTGGVLRTIEGPAAGGLIRFNGADNVLVDGSLKFLRFRNTSSAPTFTFINDATSNQVTQCIIEGPNTSTTSGTILFSTSTGTLGNSGNTILSSDIRDRSDAAGVPANGVYSNGSAGATNGGNFVSGSSIFNWTNAGVLVSATGAGSGWTVNTNSVYQTAARTTAMTGISIQGGSGHSVLNNSIGGTAVGAGGSNLATSSTFRGIDLTVGTASATSVQGNTVKNIRSTVLGFTASYGIFLQAGLANIGNVTPNTIGSSNVAERYEINGDSYGIRVISTSTVNVSNNTINNMGTNATPDTGEFYFGMSIEGTAGAHTVVNNTITNVTNNSTPDASFSTQTIGMTVTATGIQTVRGNTISNIGSTIATAPATLNNRVWGMVISATAVGTVVDKNKIDNIYASSAGAGARVDVITGLQSQAAASATFTNNMISTTGGGASSDRSIFGILDLSAAPAISNYYFNSVNITGTATAANNTYAFNRNNTATVTLRNNIFADSRSGGTGFHVAMANTNPAATGWSATASNFNLLFNATAAHITQWLGAAAGNNMTLAQFQTATGGDANSFSANPLFVSASDLHLQGTSPALSAGVPFGSITVDFDNDPRPASNPDIGADEIVQAVGGVIPAGTYYNVASAASGTDTLGGNVTVTNTLWLNGILSTGANTLTIDCNGTVSGASPTVYIIGNLQKNYCAAGVKGFEVGTANGYSPVSVNATAGTFPANFTVKAVQGPQPNVNAATALKRYWTLTEGGSVTANLNFNYLDPTDIMGNETNYHLIRVIGGVPAAFPNDCPVPAANKACVDFAGNQASINGVTEFSDWTLGEVTAPTAAPATISGQVTTSSGAPLAGVTLYLTGARSGRAISDNNGNYRFVNVDIDNFYTVTPVITNYHFSPPNRSFSLLANKTDATFTGALDAVITGNVIDTPEYFVRQHYLDFLGREPDDAGLNFWSEQMRGCGNDFNCVERRTINVSAAYFLSIEFQETGGLVDGLYRASYGRAPLFAEFMPDTATVAHNVIVGEAGWQALLASNKQQFLDAWVQRAAFRAAYDNLTNDSYVDALISHTGVTFTDGERAALVGGLTDGTLTRAAVLAQVAGNERFVRAKFNEAFVRMQYFGYLRRDPDDSGFHFWLNKLNEFEGNFERAEMVKAFLISGEYRDRFRQ